MTRTHPQCQASGWGFARPIFVASNPDLPNLILSTVSGLHTPQLAQGEAYKPAGLGCIKASAGCADFTLLAYWAQIAWMRHVVHPPALRNDHLSEGLACGIRCAASYSSWRGSG